VDLLRHHVIRFWILFPNIIGLVTGGGQLYILYKFADSDEEERPLLRATASKTKYAATQKVALVQSTPWTDSDHNDEESPQVRPTMPVSAPSNPVKEEETASTKYEESAYSSSKGQYEESTSSNWVDGSGGTGCGGTGGT